MALVSWSLLRRLSMRNTEHEQAAPRNAAFQAWADTVLIRIHSRNPLLGWNRQKVFHLLIGSSNLGNFLYFVLTLVAACKSWTCWSQSCGFIVMAFPKILFVAAFLLLLSFWVDLCHHSNDDDEDDGWNPQDTLLEKTNTTDSNTSNRCRCFSFMSIRIGSRQKVVILVSILIFAIMVVASVLIWIGMGKNPIDSAVVAQARILASLLSSVLACICRSDGHSSSFARRSLGLLRTKLRVSVVKFAKLGLILFLKMRKVRSDRASTEMWKVNYFVAGLAIVSVICFTSSAAVAMATNIPLVYHWHEQQIGDIYTSLLLVLYYFIGSSVPSAFVLFVMRELPPLALINSRRESTTIAFISDRSVAVHPQRRTNETNARSQGRKKSNGTGHDAAPSQALEGNRGYDTHLSFVPSSLKQLWVLYIAATHGRC
ncbi:hypothetical protein SASPL_117087 [Salvia splendens]|uniref:THH1/TOM1/TOM3 domain-containing protein n=1 Tax=Salvia splendens TaxID=180675 RepID=A0A8X8XU74_SALSN|nr:hypothetical protein SASPL_117087 [Salvia splendens]